LVLVETVEIRHLVAQSVVHHLVEEPCSALLKVLAFLLQAWIRLMALHRPEPKQAPIGLAPEQWLTSSLSLEVGFVTL
jgi:hypothetical protein